MVFLYGEPGTGKTSLAHGLAQQLSIRFSGQYESFHFVELKAQQLFSKWFSESGKRVAQLFDTLIETLSDPLVYVCILMDEVESVLMSRSRGGDEPSDGIRVVNAMLTQLDRLRAHPNCLVIATSNLATTVDPAFRDRADVRFHVGLPGRRTIYTMLRSCIHELIRVNLVTTPESPNGVKILDVSAVMALVRGNGYLTTDAVMQSDCVRYSLALWQIAQDCEGSSGRRVRKLPVLGLMNGIGVQMDIYLMSLQQSAKQDTSSTFENCL
jgi:SpoVK/Ycf46/Vps4 family AAA+-type ATPase